MLDTSHPQSRWIFAASRECDALRNILREVDGGGTPSSAFTPHVAELKKIGEAHFSGSPLIPIQLSVIEQAVARSTWSEKESKEVFQAIVALESAEGFECVWI